MESQRNNTKATNSKRKPAVSLPKEHKSVPSRQTFNRSPWWKQDTGPEIIRVDHSQLQPDSVPVDSNLKSELLCSYNWQEISVPTIYVPGAPPSWKPHSLPVALPPDKGGRYIDQNAHRVPDYPFEPMFRAISVMKPDFDFSDIDIVTNRNSLRKLLDFSSGKLWDPFRIDLNMVKNTLILTRRERRTRENTNLSNLGYGSNFEHHFTSAQKELEDSSSHHRVSRYKLGELDCVVRYEVDACMQDEGVRHEKTDKAESAAVETRDVAEDLLDSLKSLSLTAQKEPVQKFKDKKTKQIGFCRTNVVQQGNPVDSAKLVELKSKAKVPRIKDFIPQLWFGRIPYLIIGIHENGTFNSVSITETADEFRKFEEHNQDRLCKLVHLIKLLRDATMKTEDKACVVVCEPKVKPLRLNVYTSTNKKSVLPIEMIDAHWRGTEA